MISILGLKQLGQSHNSIPKIVNIQNSSKFDCSEFMLVGEKKLGEGMAIVR
jgi:hypothetical protein